MERTAVDAKCEIIGEHVLPLDMKKKITDMLTR